MLWLYQCPPPALAHLMCAERKRLHSHPTSCICDQYTNAGETQLEWNKTCSLFFVLNPYHPGSWVCSVLGFGVQNKCQKSCQVSGLASTKLSIPVCLVHMGCRKRALLLSSLPANQTFSLPLPSLWEFCLIFFKGRVWVKLPGRCAVLSEREVGIKIVVRENTGWFFGGMIPALFCWFLLLLLFHGPICSLAGWGMHVFGVLCPEKVSLAKEHACKNSSDEASFALARSWSQIGY